VRCLSQGVNAAHIIDGRSKHSVLMELLTDEVDDVVLHRPADRLSALRELHPVGTHIRSHATFNQHVACVSLCWPRGVRYCEAGAGMVLQQQSYTQYVGCAVVCYGF
jgi:hypothetical protein